MKVAVDVRNAQQGRRTISWERTCGGVSGVYVVNRARRRRRDGRGCYRPFMEIPFAMRGRPGHVVVDCAPNVHPELVGCPPEARDYPVCTATVDYPFRGYDSLMGWVQLVRSDDNVSGGERFEIDPLAFLGALPHPYCWLGLNPILFDAPSRTPRVEMTWTAHSFLCVPDDVGNGLEVRAMLGFAWGFRCEDGQITLAPPTLLDESAWTDHTSALADQFPAWQFSPGFADLA